MKRFDKQKVIQFAREQITKDSNYKNVMSEPHEIIYSPKENLRQILQNYKAFSKSIDAFIKSWAEDENIRNRPERQKLCSELCEISPRPVKIGDLIIKIEKATGIQIQ